MARNILFAYIIQNIIFCVQQEKEMHAGLDGNVMEEIPNLYI